VKIILDPASEKGSYFATCQEVCRKNVERACGVLSPGRSLGCRKVMNVCVIMHNMITESGGETPSDDEHPFDFRDLLLMLSR
jgi:hypothetical protein